MKVALVCRLLGHCRQAFYQSKADIAKEVERESVFIDAVLEISLANGDVCFLHLITDAYFHMIVGWALADSLSIHRWKR